MSEHRNQPHPSCVRSSCGPTVKHQGSSWQGEPLWDQARAQSCWHWQRDLLKICLRWKQRRKNIPCEKSKAILIIYPLLHNKPCTKLSGLKHHSYSISQFWGSGIWTRLGWAVLLHQGGITLDYLAIISWWLVRIRGPKCQRIYSCSYCLPGEIYVPSLRSQLPDDLSLLRKQKESCPLCTHVPRNKQFLVNDSSIF